MLVSALLSPSPASSSALTRAIAAETPALLRAARQLTGGPDAEDLVQNTIERALRHRDTFRAGTNLTAWLRRIMSNLLVDEWRRRNCRPEHNLDGHHDALDHVVAPEPEAPEEREAPWRDLGATDLRQAIERLPPAFRAIYELHLAGLPYAEIARRLDVPLGTVGTRLLRARLRLRALLSETLAQRQRAAAQAAISITPLPLPATRPDRCQAPAQLPVRRKAS